MPSCTSARPRTLSSAIHRALPTPPTKGFGLLGILVTLALTSAVIGVAYSAYASAHRSSLVLDAAQSARGINQRVLASYSGAADFSGLTTTQGIHDGLFPTNVIQGSHPVHAWGGPIELAPVNLPGPSGPGHDNGFALTFDSVDPASCAQFAVNASQGFYDVRINGASVRTGSAVPMATATVMCGQSATPSVQFIQAKVSPNGAQLAHLDPCVVLPPQYQNVACPAGQISSVPPYGANGLTQKRTSFCSGAYGPVSWGPWSADSSTCAPMCVAPPGTTQSQSQPAGCPAGQVTAAGAASFTQVQTRPVQYTCPAPTGGYTTTYGGWSAWSPTAATACAPKCTAPAPTTQTQTLGCPTGQTGSITQRRSVTYTCPAPTGAFSTAYGSWSTTSNTCAAPPPPVTYRWEMTDTQSYGGHGGEGQEYYTCSWTGPGEGDIGKDFNPGPCSKSNVGDEYYCSVLVPQSHDDIQDDTYTCSAN